jgi:beta-glucosidase
MRIVSVLAVVISVAAFQSTGPRPAARQDSEAFLRAQFQAPPALSPADASRIDDLVRQMSVTEKVGQMTQLEIGMITDGQDANLVINPGKLRKAIVEYGVGSILNVKDTALTPAKWNELLSAIQQAAAGTRLKIPVLYGIDTIHGANYVAGATLFPQPLGMAATWDPELMKETSQIAARETRAVGIPWNFSPVLDIGRQPLWPRLYETFGEDPHLASVMGAAAVRGYQGDDPAAPTAVAATLKHYVGYSFPTSGHDRTPALIPERTLREYFLPTFAAGVRAGALSVMVNSSEVNGIPGHVNKHLLTDVLRGELGFDGVVVSDWEDIKKLVSTHHTSATERDATRDAVLAGIDMSMVPSDYSFSDLLVPLVNEGAVPMPRIDEAVRRILTMKARVGLFASSTQPPAATANIGSRASRAVARRAAQESIVLEKNADALLPLRSGARVLVTGPTADSLPSLDNGWTITWQGNRPELYPRDRHTIRAALSARLGDRVTYVPGATFDKDQDIAAARSAAAQADAVVLCLGELSYAETPGNIDDLSLPAAQLRLADAVISSGKPVILVMVEGRPRLVETIAERAAAILIALNPGLEGGDALADILLGDANPSGRLPLTYPRAPNALLTYDHKAFEEQDTTFGLKAFHPQFEFGSGLSYTTFQYSDLGVSAETPTFDSGVGVSVVVRNTGARAGAEVVELFVADRVASITPPVKRLRRFVRVDLAPDEARTITFHLSRDDLSFIGADNKPIVEPGVFTVMVGGLSHDVTVK